MTVVAADAPIVLDVQAMRVAVRTDHGDGPVLVDDVSLQLRRGEVIGLIGESGAGKSTIGLASMGYTRRNCFIVGGKVLLGGAGDLRAMTPDQRRALRGLKISYIAQSAAASFNPAMTLMDQVCEAPVRHGVMDTATARAAAVQLFRELDLPHPETIGGRYPHQVSGGQLQRVMAAMAMIGRPEVIVFDEPTTALDVTTQVECLASFRRLVREHGSAALYITHDLAVVAQIADRIMVLRRGKMVEFGDARQILQEPREDYTRRLVSERIAGHTFVAKPEGTAPLLAVKGVTAHYAGRPNVIDDVSLEIQAGDTVAVVGESGSGKSTLARVVTGLLPRAAGDVRFNGASLAPRLKDRSLDQLRRIQMIYQMPDVALNPQQTLLDVIGRPVAFYFKRSRAEVRVRVLELLRQMDLPEHFIDRKTSELSGGQKQRVSIARALAAEPDLIICDEVTSALDQLVGEEILRLLKRLQDELGIGYMFITHDLGTVKRIANKVVVMLRGKMVAGGDTASVFAPPYHPYTELLLSSVPEMRPDWLDEALARRAARIVA